MKGLEDTLRKFMKEVEQERRLGDKRAEQFYEMIDALGGGGDELVKVGAAGTPDYLNDTYFDRTVGEHVYIKPNTIANMLTDHTKAVHDALNIDAGTVDGVSLPGTIAAVLSDHNKAAHDTLNIDADTLDSINSPSFLRSDVDDNLAAAIIVPDANRDEGIFGTYNSAKTQHIWSMGIGYRCSPTGANFGNLYGLAYKYNGVAGGHGVYLVNAGSEKCGLGTNVWTSGVFKTTKATGTAPLTVASTTKVSNLNADLLEGYHASTTAAQANTIPIRNASGYLYLGWINTVSGLASTVSRIYCSQDAFIRYLSPANLCLQLRASNEVMREVWHTTITNLAGSMAESLTYIDLDLTAYSSALAKGVICNVTFKRNVLNNAHNNNGVCFRKNGTSVAYHAKVQMTCDNRSGGTKTWYQSQQVRIPCDTSQKIEWLVFPATSVIIDEFYVVGYWE